MAVARESLQNGFGPRPQLVWGTPSRALSPLPIQVIRSDHLLFVSLPHFSQSSTQYLNWPDEYACSRIDQALSLRFQAAHQC